MTNFINQQSDFTSLAVQNPPMPSWEALPPVKKRWSKGKTILFFLITVTVLFGVLSAIYLPSIGQLLGYAIVARSHAEAAGLHLKNHELIKAETELAETVKNLTWARDEFRKFKPLIAVPWIGRQVKAADRLLTVGFELSTAAEEFTVFLNQTIIAVAGHAEVSYQVLTEQQKQEIIQRVLAATSLLNNLQERLAISAVAIDELPDSGLIKPLAEITVPFKELLPLINKIVDLGDKFRMILPELVGFPEEKVYLLLLVNNDELRPAGGFIGTYGILRIYQGELKEFYTRNIYEIDAPAENAGLIKEEPPTPLVKYLGVPYWYMRDANWSPDYAISAENVERFYHLEQGEIKRFDGVIAFTPWMIEEILGIIGPLAVEGETFTKDNFVDTLQFRVEQRFVQLGIPDIQRKAIIGVLGETIINRLFELPIKKLISTGFAILNRALTEKQLLIYHHNPIIQELAEQSNWAGRVIDTPNDYLLVVDANLAALKTDQVMDKSITYRIVPEDGRLRAKVAIRYKNNGGFSYKTTRYRTYTRVYVPLGSEFIRGEGMMVTDRDTRVGTVDVGEELGKTVFGAFIAIEPGDEGILSFEYYLPTSLKLKLDQDFYNLLVQKQIGTDQHKLTLDLLFDKPIKSATPGEKSAEHGDEYYRVLTDLRIDRGFWVRF